MIQALTERATQKPYLFALKAARKYGQRPTAMLLHDPYAGNRKHWRWMWGELWRPKPSDKDWTFWDYVLADIVEIIEGYTDPNNGQLRWIDESGDVWWDVKESYSGFDEAVENKQAKDEEHKPGVSYYAVPIFNDNLPRPTLESWIKAQASETTTRIPAEHAGAHRPSAEELSAMGF